MQDLQDIKKKVDEIHGFLFGSVDKPNSIHLRLDRIEQRQENRKWFTGIMALVVGGLGIDKLIQLLKHL